ncbi:MAG TPA: DGQHR domain-containing protein [Acidiferrobacterales bacterium]
MKKEPKIDSVSVIVPTNPFVLRTGEKVCLCALDVEKLMQWWPGLPHFPHRNAKKVKSIQRSLDWKRVAHIAAYLLQEELIDAPAMIEKYFTEIYEPRQNEPGREWPPKVNKVVGFSRSVYPTFSNILVHVNGAQLIEDPDKLGSGTLKINPDSEDLAVTVIDGQHRVNGAYLALMVKRETNQTAEFDLPAQVFIDLDQPRGPPRKQAQIFIDVNFYQKKVDRSLVADLFPTARGEATSTDDKDRAQDIARKLMLEKGPLVGMIQIPGIKYGVKDVITLSTLVGAVEDVIEPLRRADLTSLDEQADFIAQALDSWLEATGRREAPDDKKKLSSENVVYQGRILVSVISLIPAMLWRLKKSKHPLISQHSQARLAEWLKRVIGSAGLLDKKGNFISKAEFKKGGYLGSGGIGRFRNRLWASVLDSNQKIARMQDEKISSIAEHNKASVMEEIGES